MTDWTAIRERYIRDDIPVRLGSLAANLSRMTELATNDANQDVVESIIVESKFFIEWIAPEADIDMAAELVEMQIQLARWERNWASIWANPVQRGKVAEQAGAWSERILAMSRLE